MDEAVVDRDGPPAACSVEPERGGRAFRPGDDVELPTKPVPPGIDDGGRARRGVLDVLPVQGVEHNVPFELDLMLIRHVLELTAPALGDVGAGRRDSVRRRLNDSYDLSERRRALAVPDCNLDLSTGNAT